MLYGAARQIDTSCDGGYKRPLTDHQRNRIKIFKPRKKKGQRNQKVALARLGSPGRARTYDKRINSPLLYQLSYRGICADSRPIGLVSGCVV